MWPPPSATPCCTAPRAGHCKCCRQNAGILARGCRLPRARPVGPHTRSLRSVFSEAHVPEKNELQLYFAACGRRNSAESFFRARYTPPSCTASRLFGSLKAVRPRAGARLRRFPEKRKRPPALLGPAAIRFVGWSISRRPGRPSRGCRCWRHRTTERRYPRRRLPHHWRRQRPAQRPGSRSGRDPGSRSR